jgi:hypothetical protein
MHESMHESRPTTGGSKIVLKRFYYLFGREGDGNWNWETLGKRALEAPVDQPTRTMDPVPGQPRVSCMATVSPDNKSCHWFDEWGHDHIYEYRQHWYDIYYIIVLPLPSGDSDEIGFQG